MIYGGLIAFDLSDAPEVWEFFGDFAAASPDELALLMALVHRTRRVTRHKIAAVCMCHCARIPRRARRPRPPSEGPRPR